MGGANQNVDTNYSCFKILYTLSKALSPPLYDLITKLLVYGPCVFGPQMRHSQHTKKKAEKNMLNNEVVLCG